MTAVVTQTEQNKVVYPSSLSIKIQKVGDAHPLPTFAKFKLAEPIKAGEIMHEFLPVDLKSDITEEEYTQLCTIVGKVFDRSAKRFLGDSVEIS